MGTAIVIILIILFTCWVKRKDWFPKKHLQKPQETSEKIHVEKKQEMSPPAPKKNDRLEIIGGVLILVLVITIGIFLFILISNLFKGCNENNGNSYTKNSLPFREYFTPCEVTENGEFYLESDDSIAQKFPGISDIIIYSGKGKSEVPEGRWKGPIKFWYPGNPNEHKSFRIYPK